MNRLLMVVAALLSGLALAGKSIAYEGRVIEAETSRPMSDVWVIGRWEVGGGLVHGGGGCVLAIVRTGSDGSFNLESREGFLRSIWPLRDRPAIVLYLAGYVGRDKMESDSSNVFVVEPDLRTVDDRLTHLMKTMSFADCGAHYSYDHRELLRPLYQQIDSEARQIAVTPSARNRLGVTSEFLSGIDIPPDRRW